MLKRVVWITIVAILLGWIIIVQVEKRQAESFALEQHRQLQERVKAQVEVLRLASGGNFDWVKEAKGLGDLLWGKVLSIELEKVLVGNVG